MDKTKKDVENSLNDPFGIDELQRRKQAVLDQASEKARIRQHKKGRLTARERIQQLLDPDSFVERGMLAHSDLKAAREKSPADGKVCGQGSIEGKAVCVSADDVSVMAGAGGRVGYKKEYELQLYAQQRGLPYIHMGDGGGARIPDIMGATGMMTFTVPVNHAARNRGNFMATVIMGECYGGPTWKACQSDIVIQVKGTSMAVSGPPVLAAATKEQVSPEELGGWEVHAKTTGLVDLFAENDQHALEIIPQLLSYFPPNAAELPPIAPAREPATEEGDILELVPQDARKTYSMHKVLKTLVDADSLLELKPYFDGSLITALARLDGKVVGILANNPKVMAGAMGPGACEKAMSFISLCDSYHIPLLFIHDTPGFYVSKAAEMRKMPQKIMSFIDAIQQSSVPRLSLIMRKSYGMAHCNMVGARMGADSLLAWPKAEISFMSPLVAVEVVLGRKMKESAHPEAMRDAFLQEMDKMNAPWEAAGANLIDRIIDPRETRQELIQALNLALSSDTHRRSARHLSNWPRMT